MLTSATTAEFGLADSVAAVIARATESALAGLLSATAADRGCCFTFHRVATPAEWPHQPNRGFHIDLSYLERLINHVRHTGWEIVCLSEALARASRPGSGRFVNFSVDDCYRDTVELLLPLFRRLNAPVTLFVTTGIPDRLFHLRDAGLETLLQRRAVCCEDDQAFALDTAEQKREAYAAITAKWDSSADPGESYVRFCRRHGQDPDALDDIHRITWPMLEAVSDDHLVEIGGHTVNHSRISALGETDAMGEITGCRDRLQSRLGRPIKHFAFPYGRSGDCGARDFDLARRAGFETAATTRKGLIRSGSDPFQLPRNTLNGVHRQLPFAYAHLSGVSGLAARIMRRD